MIFCEPVIRDGLAALMSNAMSGHRDADAMLTNERTEERKRQRLSDWRLLKLSARRCC